jgi:hypothetical protein
LGNEIEHDRAISDDDPRFNQDYKASMITAGSIIQSDPNQSQDPMRASLIEHTNNVKAILDSLKPSDDTIQEEETQLHISNLEKTIKTITTPEPDEVEAADELRFIQYEEEQQLSQQSTPRDSHRKVESAEEYGGLTDQSKQYLHEHQVSMVDDALVTPGTGGYEEEPELVVEEPILTVEEPTTNDDAAAP